MANIKLGIAPIAWTNDDMPDLGKENTFEQCVSEMALAGFTGCEIGNKYPKDPAVLKKALDLRGLQIASAWFSSYLLTQPYEQVEKDFIKHCVSYALENCADDINFLAQMYDKELVNRLKFIVENDFVRLTYTEGVDILMKSGKKFEFPVSWGIDLQSEHERSGQARQGCLPRQAAQHGRAVEDAR